MQGAPDSDIRRHKVADFRGGKPPGGPSNTPMIARFGDGRVFAQDEIPHVRVSVGQKFDIMQRCPIVDSARIAIRDPTG
jgi:hypothetical protein